MDSWLLLGAALLLLRKPKAEKDGSAKDEEAPSDADGSGSKLPKNQGDFWEFGDWWTPDPTQPHIGPGPGWYRDPIFQPAGIPGINLPNGVPSAGGLPGVPTSAGGGFGSDPRSGVTDVSGSPFGITNRNQLSASDDTLQYALASIPAAITQKIANVNALSSFQARAAQQRLSLAKRALSFHRRLIKRIFG